MLWRFRILSLKLDVFPTACVLIGGAILACALALSWELYEEREGYERKIAEARRSAAAMEMEGKFDEAAEGYYALLADYGHLAHPNQVYFHPRMSTLANEKDRIHRLKADAQRLEDTRIASEQLVMLGDAIGFNDRERIRSAVDMLESSNFDFSTIDDEAIQVYFRLKRWDQEHSAAESRGQILRRGTTLCRFWRVRDLVR